MKKCRCGRLVLETERVCHECWRESVQVGKIKRVSFKKNDEHEKICLECPRMNNCPFNKKFEACKAYWGDMCKYGERIIPNKKEDTKNTNDLGSSNVVDFDPVSKYADGEK
ncbi:MAG: hypothetical protein GF349_02320 [Candidatus Magasanikbacteria bacterium]|nr:hypothetical protein [Candidatus Magasanikbacteria bacterium]